VENDEREELPKVDGREGELYDFFRLLVKLLTFSGLDTGCVPWRRVGRLIDVRVGMLVRRVGLVAAARLASACAAFLPR
jgi:hypothetical protein